MSSNFQVLPSRRLAGGWLRDRGFSPHGAVYDLEARFIERASEEAEGSVSRAAKLPGMKHQSPIHLLNPSASTMLTHSARSASIGSTFVARRAGT